MCHLHPWFRIWVLVHYGCDSFQKHSLNPNRAPHKLLFWLKMAEGKFDQLFSFRLVQNGEDKVVHNALLDLGKVAMHQGLFEEEVNQRCLIVTEAQ